MLTITDAVTPTAFSVKRDCYL